MGKTYNPFIPELNCFLFGAGTQTYEKHSYNIVIVKCLGGEDEEVKRITASSNKKARDVFNKMIQEYEMKNYDVELWIDDELIDANTWRV